MTMKLQEIIYSELKGKIYRYPVYTSPNDSLKLPYIIIEGISVKKLPYSQELYRYEEVDVTIAIYDKRYSNKSCLETLEKVISLLEKLPDKYSNISNLSISSETQDNRHSFAAKISISFHNITS
jgi:hypothetical protein